MCETDKDLPKKFAYKIRIMKSRYFSYYLYN